MVIKVTIMVVAVIVAATAVEEVVVGIVVCLMVIIMMVDVDKFDGGVLVAFFLTFEKRFTNLKYIKYFLPK